MRALPSKAEVAVLQALAAQGEALVSRSAGGMSSFRSRLLVVDSEQKFLVIGCSGDESTDVAFLSAPSVDLFVEWGEWRISFMARGPELVSHEGVSAIRLQFPEAVSISRRRMFERAAVPAHAPLRLVAYSGNAVIFDAAITDVSPGGIGIQSDSTGGALEPGMILTGCRMECAGREPLVVDIEIRHTASTTRPDGSLTLRAGCRFVNLAPAAMALVVEYARNRAASQ